MYVISGGLGDTSGDSWANAMSLAAFEVDVEAAMEAGNVYYILAGTYTLTDSISSDLDGGDGTPISFVGVADTASPATRGSGDDRPTFVCGAYFVRNDNYITWENCRFLGTGGSVLRVDRRCFVKNCYANNSSGTANRDAFDSQSTATNFFDCEMESTNGIGSDNYGPSNFRNCYVHHSSVGIETGPPSIFSENIVAICSTVGIKVTGSNCHLFGNTIYGCIAGMVHTAALAMGVVRNNIFSQCTIGLEGTGINFNLDIDYNDWFGNTADCALYDTGANCISVDPVFTNTADGSEDFSLDSSSGLLGSAFGIRLGVG